MKSVLKSNDHKRKRKVSCPICLKFVRREIEHHSHGQSNAIQDRRRGEHVFPAI